MGAEARAAALGLDIPDYADPPYGGRYGRVKAFHRVGDFVEFSGITPETRGGDQLHPGVVGVDVTLEQAREAARFTAINALGMMRLALGSLDQVAGLSRALCFVLTPPAYPPIYEVAQAASDVFLDVFGDEIGTAGRATFGVASLSRNNCFELLLSLEAASKG